MVYRIYVEKKPGLSEEAASLCRELRNLVGLKSLTSVRIVNRYDAEHITKELFDEAVRTVFSEPPVDTASETLDTGDRHVFAVEYLPGQFDQRADSAEQCIQIMSCGQRPTIRTAKVYLLEGDLTEADLRTVKAYVINPVEAREASLDCPDTLDLPYDVPETVETLDGFCLLDDEGLEAFLNRYGLAMDEDDLRFCRDYFRGEKRDPTMTEIRMIDTYWSDHCRHTTFLTAIDRVEFEDPLLKETYEKYLSVRRELGRTKPCSLMDLATIACKYLKKQGLLDKLDESEEINACTVKMTVEADGKKEPWLLLFKNETHNHPTEIEPFGGAATCIGGAIRDPLSGRAYVYAAMRVTGAGNPLTPVSETLKGKLPQRKIVQSAADGYSSYGNQIGLATGMVDEIYHDGYQAKRMEIGAVVAAVPAENVRRECPEPGDAVILLGGRTGRDGCGGATGSSKKHTLSSLSSCGAEVQKGNAPEERKLQRLFRNPEASRLIRRCNDFGAGGVSVAVGELADGLDIDLNAVPKKYEGLDGTELAISESQERMAVVVEEKDVARFLELSDSENLEATVVAHVTEEPRLRMHWNGHTIVDLSREFLNSNGAEKHISIIAAKPEAFGKPSVTDFSRAYRTMAEDLNICSKRGLSERFDSTIGAGTVLMPFGGRRQLTPIQTMVHKIPTGYKHTDTCSYMAWGFNPFISEKSPFHGAYLAVVESVSKLIAAGASFEDVYLTFQEYFEKPNGDGRRFGQPLSALLGAFRAQLDLGIASIGGKDSMSGSFENLDVPPTLVSFAVTTGTTGEVVSDEFKAAGHRVIRLTPDYDENGLPVAESLKACFRHITKLMRDGKVFSAWTLVLGGVAEGILKMAMGNGFGFAYDEALTNDDIFGYGCGSFLLEVDGTTADEEIAGGARNIGTVTEEAVIRRGDETLSMEELCGLYESRLESVYPCAEGQTDACKPETFSYTGGTTKAPNLHIARPKVLIPVFPGTNCEYDSAKALADAGADPSVFVIRNRDSDSISRSVEAFASEVTSSQMVFIPGGFSGGDEPEGSGKFITAFFRNEAIRNAVEDLLGRRDGLMCGICNGFQALIKLGLVPFGHITATDENCPTLTFNTISRHQSKLVRVRVASRKSPWLAASEVGDVYRVAISHGEGRFLASDEWVKKLAENGQIATQYVDFDDQATSDIRFNPNHSVQAIEGITSPDGRVFGRMGHTERAGNGLYRNVPGRFDLDMFRSAVRYFR